MPFGIPAAETINHVQDLLTILGNTPFVNAHHSHVRLWYRGQKNRAWELDPGVYRPPFPVNEGDKWRQECHLTQDFRIEAASVLTHSVNDTQLYFLQQHYRMPTRLLDWTGNPLAALYFASEKFSDPDVNGAFFLMDAYQLSEHQGIPHDVYRGIATGSHPVFKRALENIFHWRQPTDYPGFIMAVRPDHFDARVTNQRSYFTFHVPNTSRLTPTQNRTLIWFEVPAAAKDGIRRELFRLNTDEFSIYRDLDHLSVRLRYAYNL